MIRHRSLVLCIPIIWGGAFAVCGQTRQTIVLPAVNLAATEPAKISIMSSAAGHPGGFFLVTCLASVMFHGVDGSALDEATTVSIGSTEHIFSAARFKRWKGFEYGCWRPNSAHLTPFMVSPLIPTRPLSAVAFSLGTFQQEDVKG